MVQAILEHVIGAPNERARDADIRHVASGKEQCALAPAKGCELFFQRLMLDAVTGHQVRRAAADAVMRGGITQRSYDARMMCQAEIVIAAEDGARCAFDYGHDAV